MQKQIEEMADIVEDYYDTAERTGSELCGYEVAEAIYNAGYRKQEWISVEERLPAKNYYGYVLAWDGRYVEFLHYSHRYQKWDDYATMKTHPFEVTHWMPLPEPPKGE